MYCDSVWFVFVIVVCGWSKGRSTTTWGSRCGGGNGAGAGSSGGGNLCPDPDPEGRTIFSLGPWVSSSRNLPRLCPEESRGDARGGPSIGGRRRGESLSVWAGCWRGRCSDEATLVVRFKLRGAPGGVAEVGFLTWD